MTVTEMAREAARDEEMPPGRRAYYARMEKFERAGMEKGLEKGIVLGRQEGMEKGLLLAALGMKRLGMDISSIIEATGLSEEAILKL